MARNLCSPTAISYGWVSPTGKVYPISQGTHEDWALRHVTPNSEWFKIEQLEKEAAWFSLEASNKLEDLKTNAFLQLVDDGWIRMSNAYNLDAEPAARSKAWEAALRLTVDCVLSQGKDPFTTPMHVSIGQQAGSRTTVDAAVHKYAPQLESVLYGTGKTAGNRPSPKRVVQAFLQGVF